MRYSLHPVGAGAFLSVVMQLQNVGKEQYLKLFAGANAVIRLQKQVQEKHLLFSSPDLLFGFG